MGAADGGARRRAWLHWALHNLIAHPLLVLWPSVGARLHDWTAERMGS